MERIPLFPLFQNPFLSLIIVENVDPVASELSLGNLLKMFQIKLKDSCDSKVLKCFSK